MSKTKAPTIAPSNRDKIARFADRLVKLADDYRDDKASVIEDAKKAEIDTAALGRLVSWMRKDHIKRAEQEAIDEQYRFLAGENETPATLPPEGMLSEAARLYRDKLSVRQVAGVLKISTGKAFKLKALAELFTVHVRADVNTEHDADGVITETPAERSVGEVEGTAESRAAQPDDLANESCGGTLSDRASETLEATVSEGSAVLTADDAGTARTGSLAPSLTDVASRCEPGPQDPIDDLAIPSFLRRAQVRA